MLTSLDLRRGLPLEVRSRELIFECVQTLTISPRFLALLNLTHEWIEPRQVFQLLETIYAAFDKIAYKEGVFKIETIEDKYLAVAGLPEETDDHALRVAKFARACVDSMSKLTRRLEVTLGYVTLLFPSFDHLLCSYVLRSVCSFSPDTTDLELRIGIHTGQVTAGILKGERSRFQLFGDTVGTGKFWEYSFYLSFPIQ